MPRKLLTKSNYLTGLQCPKLLWITKNDKDRIPEPDEIQQLTAFATIECENNK